MLKNLIKITFRNLFKNKAFSFINILGLSIGITCFVLISLFIHDEINYDSFNQNAENIYRLNSKYKIGVNRFNIADSPMPLAPAVKDEFPEVLFTTRIEDESETFIKLNDDYIKEENFFYVDSTIFDVFTIELVLGKKEGALNDPWEIVLTTETAVKYFGNNNPVGQTISLSDGKEFKVNGVVKPLPENSHFEFDFLASIYSLPAHTDQSWFGRFAHSYVLLPAGYNIAELQNKLPAMTKKYLDPIVKGGFGMSFDQFIASGNEISFEFIPLLDIHLHSNVVNEFKTLGDINTVYIFSAIAVFILLIACINFINLATAKSTKRANEVGVRKVVGSTKSQLVFQFLAESVFISLISIFISVGIIEIILPYFNSISNKSLAVDYFSNPLIIPGFIILGVIIGLLAGFYPSFLLSKFNPVSVLKGKLFRNSKGISLRKGLVVFQFSISIILLIGTFIIFQQMEYVKNKNLGLNQDQVIVVKNLASLGQRQKAFKQTIMENPGIINSSISNTLPNFSLNASIYQKDDGTQENQTLVTIVSDYDYIDTYQIELDKGRNFSESITTDTSALILNQAALKQLLLDDPLNQRLLGGASKYMNIIGVVKDFHFQSLKDKIRPMAFQLLLNTQGNFLSVKMKPDNIRETIAFLKETWESFSPQKPFDYNFYDDSFAEIYEAEIQTGEIFTSFAALAIFIACLGLFGLAAFTAEQKTKEIGIRKVMGSSILQVILLLSKDFMKWVLLANIVAWPVAYYIMQKWLEDFVYRIEISFTYFAVAGLLALVIAMATISFRSIRAALANPVESLKYE